MKETTENIPAIEKLRLQLEAAGIDTSKFGIENAKTLENLQKEIDEGETILTTTESGEIIRNLTVGGTNILYLSTDGKKYHLEEERQVFKDGRERRRGLEVSVSEKLKCNENPQEAMARGIREELGLVGEIPLIKKGVDEWSDTTPSYPGLQTHYTRHTFELVMNDKQFNPQGYVEVQDNLTTYFVWKEITN